MANRHVGDVLVAYVHGELHGEELEAVEEHLRFCRDCRAELESVRVVSSALYRRGRVEPSEQVWNKIEAATRAKPQSRPRVRGFALAFATCIVLVSLVFATFMLRAATPSLAAKNGFVVRSVKGGSLTDSTGPVQPGGTFLVGETIETSPTTTCEVELPEIGQITLGKASKLSLVATGPNEHRVRLDRGHLSAKVVAPPRLFVVETPLATAVDLGCEYSIDVDADGNSVLTVVTGWVAMEQRNGPDSVVPAGWKCVTSKHCGVGTPLRIDAPKSFANELADFDSVASEEGLKNILKEASTDDALTLWHLLFRTRDKDREDVFDRLEALKPRPEGVTRKLALDLDRAALELWRDSMIGLQSMPIIFD